MKRMKKISAAAFTVGWLVILVCTYGCTTKEAREPYVDQNGVLVDNPMTTEKAIEFRMAMRRLWDDHALWTRNVIFCLVDDLPGADQAVERLLKNQDDIGDALKPYYGKDAGKELTELLYPHINIAAEVIKAARANDKAALDNANARWYVNADEISAFLSNANPDNWELKEMSDMMHEHLALTTDEVMMRINKNYPGDIKAYTKVEDAILEMADMLSEGVIKQFPDKFSESYSNTAASAY
jgi:hypothetical protein